MKAEFLRPRFDGGRFAEHTLPLEVARDLAAYEMLVVELAKRLYLQANQNRQRVPKGFGADFHLHLQAIEPGSAVPVLAIVAASLLPLDNGAHPYFERARDLVAECVRSTQGPLPSGFPRELLVHFNQVGRSLHDGESLELAQGAVLTPQRRKQLVLAADKVYEREIELAGTIGEADWEKSTFRLRLTDGSQVIVPMPESFHAQAREYGGRNRFQVTVKGVGTFDSWDKLQKVVDVDALEVQANYQLVSRFDSLTTMEKGWFEGNGIAPEKEPLMAVAERFVGNYPETLPLPAIVPTQEGNLLFEWDVPGSPSVDLELASMRADFHAFLPGGGDLEQDFSLTTDEDWKAFFTFLDENLERYPA